MDSHLNRELRHARISDAAADRRRERSLANQAAESATFVGMCLDLAEKAAEVIVHTDNATYQGSLSAVGTDHLELAVRHGTVVVPNRVVQMVGLTSTRSTTSGGRPPPSSRCFMDVLCDLSETRSEIAVRMNVSGDDLRGVIEAVGRDVVTVRSTGPDRRRTYLPAASLGAFSVMASG